MSLRLAIVAVDEAALLRAGSDDTALRGDGSLDLDKMSDAVHSLFDANADPLFAGDPVTEDLGYGPATYVDPVEAASDISSCREIYRAGLRRAIQPIRALGA
jgi:hypothetical protein